MAQEGAELDIDLEKLLTFTEVQVVQQVDVQGLQATLKWIVGKLKAQDERQQEQLQALREQQVGWEGPACMPSQI
jgi:hypothetical protein